MKVEKVIYKFGNNDKFMYLIIDNKANAIEKEVSQESLLYKLCGKTKVKISNYGELPYGNFDYVLEKRIKETDHFCGLLLVHEDDIEKIL